MLHLAKAVGWQVAGCKLQAASGGRNVMRKYPLPFRADPMCPRGGNDFTILVSVPPARSSRHKNQGLDLVGVVLVGLVPEHTSAVPPVTFHTQPFLAWGRLGPKSTISGRLQKMLYMC